MLFQLGMWFAMLELDWLIEFITPANLNTQESQGNSTELIEAVDTSPYCCHRKQDTELEPKNHLSRCNDVLTHFSRNKNSGRRTKTRKKVLTRRKASTRIVLQRIRSQQQPKLGIRLFYRGGGWVMSAAWLCFQWQNNTKEAKKRKMTDNQQWQKIDNMIKKGKATWTWICLFSMSSCLDENKTAQTSQQHPTFSYEKTKNKDVQLWCFSNPSMISTLRWVRWRAWNNKHPREWERQVT